MRAMQNIFNRFTEWYKKSRFVKISHIVTSSATFALLLSIAFFVYETFESKKEQQELVGNLLSIQNSLTTRYLGLFPEYIANIDDLLSNGKNMYSYQSPDAKVDTIIIFEDVLYYGIKSRPEGFLKLNEKILKLSKTGCKIYIAYYNPKGRAFQQMMRETLISSSLLPKYDEDMQLFFSSLRKINFEREKILSAINNPTQQQRDSVSQLLYSEYLDSLLHIDNKAKKRLKRMRSQKSKMARFIDPIRMVDSLKCEEYYQASVELDKKKARANLKSYLEPMPIAKNAKVGSPRYAVNNLARQLDSVKYACLNAHMDNVSFADYKDMYIGFTKVMEDFYHSCGENIQLIPLNDYFTMSCWMISQSGKNQAIFAFPSKYATDEIGFYSQDEAIASYIRTMLYGVLTTTDK